MSTPVPDGSLPPPPGPVRHGVSLVSFVLGLLVTFGLVSYVFWVAIAGMTASGTATEHVAGTVATFGHSRTTPGAERASTSSPPVAALPVPPTPTGTTLVFDELWTFADGNTVAVGTPTIGTSARTGEPVVQVPVTFANNGERDWNPVSTTLVGTLNHAPVPESAEGDWMYRTPIVGHTSVTLTRVFVTGPGQFTLTVHTEHGQAMFTGRI